MTGSFADWPHVNAHLDMDAFYVAVELLRRPELVGRPVIVAGGGPRAVVTTASYEARKYGVGSAMPVSLARRRCPDAIRIPVDMAHYRERSAQVMKLIGELGVPTEPVSLDEVYLDLGGLPDPVARMSLLVGRIREELRLDASVGIGPNKLVAKVASDAEKPRGFVVLSREQAARRFADAPPRLIPGIGPKTAERLEALGVRTIGDLQRYPAADLVRRFGEHHGRALHDRAHFRAEAKVARRVAKSRSVEATFDYDIADHGELERVLAEQSARLAEQLRERGIAGRTIGIKVRLDDWTTVTRVRTVERPTHDAEVISGTAIALLRTYSPPRPVRLLGVKVAAFDEDAAARAHDPEPLTLLSA
jgi:DNA polymerase-4